MSTPILEAKGRTGTIQVYDTTVSIKMRIPTFKGEYKIPLTKLTGIHFKKPNSWTLGYIQFDYPGAELKQATAISPPNDKNTVAFPKKKLAEFEAVRDFIEQKINSKGTSQVVNEQSSADEIRKFKGLLQEGIITQEEFDAKKKQLLGI